MRACGAGAFGIDPVLSSCALCWTDWSVVALCAGALASALVSDRVLAGGAGLSGIDDAVLSVAALIAGAAFGVAAGISVSGGGAAASPGPTDTPGPSGAGFGPDGAGVECKEVAGTIVTGAAACCAGCPSARTYQHFRLVARSNR